MYTLYVLHTVCGKELSIAIVVWYRYDYCKITVPPYSKGGGGLSSDVLVQNSTTPFTIFYDIFLSTILFLYLFE